MDRTLLRNVHGQNITKCYVQTVHKTSLLYNCTQNQFTVYTSGHKTSLLVNNDGKNSTKEYTWTEHTQW